MSVPVVLHVEDNPDDAFFVRRALGNSGLALKLVHVSEGQSAINLLDPPNRQQSENPQVLLLDLKLPGLSGFDVLAWVRQHPRWKDIPVAVLTSSDLPQDIDRARELGVSTYLAKTPQCENVISFLRTILPPTPNRRDRGGTTR